MNRIKAAVPEPSLLQRFLHSELCNKIENGNQLRNEVDNRNLAREFLADSQRNVRNGMNSIELAVTKPDLLERLVRGEPRNQIESRNFAPEFLADSKRNVRNGVNSVELTVTEPDLLQRSLRQSRHPKPATRRTRGHQTLGIHLNTSLAAATSLAIALTLLTLSCGTPHSTTQSSATLPGTYLLTLTPISPQASPPPTLSLVLTVLKLPSKPSSRKAT